MLGALSSGAVAVFGLPSPGMESGLRLRAELVVEPGAIKDPLLGRTVTLGPTGIAMAPLLDGTRDAERLVAEMLAAGGAQTKIEDTLRSLTLLHLIDGIGDGVRDRIAAIWRGDVEREYLTLPETRFACQASGLCCRSYRLGPISEQERAAIAALPLREAMPDLPEGDLFVERAENLYLNTTSARCVFLRPNGHCGIHAHFGEEVKPLTCKFYPIGVQPTFEGERLYNNQHCASHFVSQVAGPTLIESAKLLRPKSVGPTTMFHPIVFVREDTPVDYSHFLYLEAALRRTVGEGEPFVQLARALDVIDSFVVVARGLPLGVDPVPVFEGWRDGVDPRSPDGPVPWGVVVEMFAHLASELATFVDVVDDIQSDDRTMAPLAREILPTLEHLHQRALACAGHHVVIDQAVEAAVPNGDDLAAALRTSLGQVFYGRLGLVDDRPMFALGQVSIALALGFVGAQQIAAAEGRPYGVAELGRGHALANRVLPTFTTPLFKLNPELARALVMALPQLTRWPQNAQE